MDPRHALRDGTYDIKSHGSLLSVEVDDHVDDIESRIDSFLDIEGITKINLHQYLEDTASQKPKQVPKRSLSGEISIIL